MKNGHEYDALYDAAMCRAEADWLVGINATRALTCKYNAQLSCGRVQTPTLAMIAKREEKIRSFIPEGYYGMTAKGQNIMLTWQDQKSKSYRSFDKEKMTGLMKKVDEQKAVVEEIKKTPKKTYAPLLYDLTELQRNMAYYGMEAPFPFPLFYYDVQKLYGLFTAEGARLSLDAAVEQEGLLEKRPFHRALDDAYYTGRVLACLVEKTGAEALLPFRSVDYYRLPGNKKEEIQVTFPGYSKYVSRVFESREDAMKDRGVTSTKCYLCGKSLRKKIRWFTANQKMYFSLAVCPEHGYLKGKIRIKKADGDRVFVVKTLKLTDEEGAAFVINKKEELKKKRAERSRAKRQRQRQEAAANKTRKKKGKKAKKERGIPNQ